MYAALMASGVALLAGSGYVMAFVFADAFAHQPGLEPDAVERMVASVGPALRRVRGWPSRLIRHHGVKLYHVWLRWQGYKPLVLSERVVWVPTHTILEPNTIF